MTEASALEMLRSPSAPSPHGEEEEGLGVAEEEDLLGRASPRGGLCGLLRACVPGGCFLLSLACCRSSSWTRLKQGDDGSEAPARKKKRSSRWKDGSSQFEEYARRAPRRYEHDLMTDDGVDGSGVENPLVSRAAAAAAAAPDSPPKAGGRAIGRALDDGTRRLTLNGKVDVFVYEAPDEDKKGIASEGVKGNRDDLRLLRKVAGKDWHSLDAETIESILAKARPPEAAAPDGAGASGTPTRAFRWNTGPPR